LALLTARPKSTGDNCLHSPDPRYWKINPSGRWNTFPTIPETVSLIASQENGNVFSCWERGIRDIVCMSCFAVGYDCCGGGENALWVLLLSVEVGMESEGDGGITVHC
jgi:hypothetical protein